MTDKKSGAPATGTPDIGARTRHDHVDSSTAEGRLAINPQHLEALQASAISQDVMRERGYRTITNAAELRKLGFAPAQCNMPGLLLPLHSTDGGQPLFIYRPDNPRVLVDKSKRDEGGQHPNKVIKYEMPKGERVHIDCPPRCKPMLGNPSIPLWITEGQKKADALASVGLCSVALLGVWNFIGRNEHGGKVILVDWDYVALNGRAVRIVFDSDVMTKPDVRQALERLTKHMQRKGASVDALYLPNSEHGKVGVDDWLAAGHSLAELNALIEAPRPTPEAAPDQFTLLDDAPETISRPLALIDGKAYAAVWPYGERKKTEMKSKNGEVWRVPVSITREQRRFVVRNDGAIFGDDDLQARDVLPLSQLGLMVDLPETPSPDKLWSTRGIKSFVAGSRPNPADVFRRVKDVVGHFVDFDLSIADQDSMAALVACYALHTWFLDAFGVTGFLWINGERGTGKSTLMFVICQLSYLGQALSPSGSFAALRDIADYSSTMGLDDAESWTNPEKTNPDIRAIVLSGNRRGVTVPVKEAGLNGQWQTRYVRVFCPRVFTAIQKPDDTLSSRCIVIPLSKSDDPGKANIDPEEYELWPHDRRKLVDDLWALAIANLPELQAYDRWVSQNSKIVGRDLQPWRGLLAVAAWLESNGVPGLWGQMADIAFTKYQAERQDLEVADVSRLIVRSIAELVSTQPDLTEWSFSSSQVSEGVKQIIDAEEIDLGPERIGTKSIGMKIAKMRLKKHPSARPRQWLVTRKILARLMNAHRLPAISKQKNSDLPPEVGGVGVVGVVGVNPSNPSNPSNLVPQVKRPSKPCSVCRRSDWIQRHDGSYFCGVCHPLGKTTTGRPTRTLS